jgi:hypothetical protein
LDGVVGNGLLVVVGAIEVQFSSSLSSDKSVKGLLVPEDVAEGPVEAGGWFSVG